MEEVQNLPVAEFNRIRKAVNTLVAQLVFWQFFFEQKVFLYVKMVFSDKICQQISLGHIKLPSSIATMLPHFFQDGCNFAFLPNSAYCVYYGVHSSQSQA